MNKFLLAIFIVLITSVGYLTADHLNGKEEARLAAVKTAEMEKKLQEEQLRKEQKAALVDFTLKAMDMAPPSRISLAKRHIISDKLADIVMKYIPNQDARESYISMVKIESNFDQSAKSPVGATGIGQIMPSTFAYTIKKMDVGAKQEDIHNEDVNLTVGAFYFNELLTEQSGNPRLASIAYNGGSKTADKFKKMGNINQESANYALKTDHVKETVRDQIEIKLVSDNDL